MIFKTTHFILVTRPTVVTIKTVRCAFAAIPLVQKLSVRDAKTKLLRTGFSCALFFQPPKKCDAECIYTVGRGEKTKTIEVRRCLVRYVMIKGLRYSGPLSDCDRAG